MKVSKLAEKIEENLKVETTPMLVSPVDRLVMWMFKPYLKGFVVVRVMGFGAFLVDKGPQRMVIYFPWYKGFV